VSGRAILSVVIPTRNRLGSLRETLGALRDQTLVVSDYEIIVVDDGSDPAVELPPSEGGARWTVLRLEGRERSAARNVGARSARGDVLVFVDDDVLVRRDFLKAHLSGQAEWPGALIVGSIRLPDEVVAVPFGRFRQALELQGIPGDRGLTDVKNFCTAANMSISRGRFLELGGFDEALVTGEDQDLALRHSQGGGLIAFLPEAAAIHSDDTVHVRDYCRRAEWSSERLVDFCERNPRWPDNVERERVNGPVHWRHEPFRWSARKILKRLVAARAVVEVLFVFAEILERSSPDSQVLERVYRLLLGAHIFRGYRRGLARVERVVGVDRSMMAADGE
jgi:glycosyltransferase involved in cell wall biosynthesis